ncbi:MAG: glycosyltransferase [Actinobacteria bacterium]|nr:glycosyltransferase [Actinomycetota bacterium]HRY10192.1 glycosyltransferase [Candidatus Nanopelagicales bacterium]
MVNDVAIVHERLSEWGGSENCVVQMTEEWPQAPVFVPFAIPGRTFDGTLPHTGNVQWLYRGGGYAHLLPLLPQAFRRLPIPDTDVVVASHHAFANQVVFATDAPVVSYVHTPARWMWDPEKRRGEMGGRAGELALATMSARMRKNDYAAAQKVHTFLANSNEVKERISKWWHREAQVLHPPVNVDYYTPDPAVAREPFVLYAGRLVPYKRPEIAVRAAERAGIDIVIAGEGRALADCQAVAGPHTRFAGRPSDTELLQLYRSCSALLMPGEEDFGIVPVEAQACGAPVVAIDAGGARDIVIPGETGLLVDPEPQEGFVDRFAEALRQLQSIDFDPAVIRMNAERFSQANFREGMAAAVAAA